MPEDKFNKVKEVKRRSRQDTKIAGRGGPHSDKRERRSKNKATKDYLYELEGEYEMDSITIGVSDILTAFDDVSIGTKVTNPIKFYEILTKAINDFDWSTCRMRGQAYIELGPEAISCVSSGVGKRTKLPSNYIIRTHRDRVGLYLRREWACEEVTGVAVVVYTNEAYRLDPDVTDEEIERMESGDCSHMLVAILAHPPGYKSPLTPNRFIKNLAGGNREALEWTAEEIRQKAAEISEHSNTWIVVAD